MKRFLELFKKQPEKQPKDYSQELDRFLTIGLLDGGLFEYQFTLDNLTDSHYKILFTLLTKECIANIIMLMQENNPDQAQLMIAKYTAFLRSAAKKTKQPVVSPLNVLGKKTDGYSPFDSDA